MEHLYFFTFTYLLMKEEEERFCLQRRRGMRGDEVVSRCAGIDRDELDGGRFVHTGPLGRGGRPSARRLTDVETGRPNLVLSQLAQSCSCGN